MAIENLLLVTNKRKVFRAKLELDLLRNIKAVTISDFKREKEARYEPSSYIKKSTDFLGANLAHISQDLCGNPTFSSYKADEIITELYVQK